MADELKVNEAIASLMKDKSQRDAFAEMIVEYVKPNHITVDFISLLLNTRSLKPGDFLVKKLRKGIEVHTLVPGSIHLAHKVTLTDRVNYMLDGSDVKVTYNEWELEAGEIGTVDEIKQEMFAKLRDHFYNKVFTALTTVWTAVNTPNNFTSVGGAITSTALEDAIDRINETTGGVKAVVGTRAAMTPITKFGDRSHGCSSTYNSFNSTCSLINSINSIFQRCRSNSTTNTGKVIWSINCCPDRSQSCKDFIIKVISKLCKHLLLNLINCANFSGFKFPLIVGNFDIRTI